MVAGFAKFHEKLYKIGRTEQRDKILEEMAQFGWGPLIQILDR